MCMSFREGRGQPVILSAVLITPWSFFRFASVHCENHTEMQNVRTLWMEER